MSDFFTELNVARIAVLSFGIVGNIISFIVFSRKTFSNNSISTYCRSLAVFDCLTIIQLIKDIFTISNPYDYLENWNDVSCKLFFYLSMQYSAIPGWILVAFSIDKMLNMRTSAPIIIKSKLFQWSVVAGIVIFHLLLYSELLISLKVEPIVFMPSIKICNFPFLSYFYPFLYAELAETCLIPFIVMIVTSIVTIRLLIRSRGLLERMGHSDKQRRKRDIKFAISSITFNVFFIAFKTPFFTAYIVTGSVNFYADYFMQISFFLFLFYCSSNFFIHFATNSIFRRELFVIFRPLIPINRVSTQSVTSRFQEFRNKIFTSLPLTNR
jgi:hypothetical protein